MTTISDGGDSYDNGGGGGGGEGHPLPAGALRSYGAG